MTIDQALEPAIRVKGIEKSFKDLHVLRGVDFDVQAGSIFALLGSNGAGKTTLVRILSTLLKADAGTATVHGFDVGARPGDVRESISLTGQFAAVDEVLTGRENLILIARLRHLKNPAVIADELLARFSLTEAGTRKAATYSGGMRRRLDIAMSLIGNPPVIFLDEPTTGLDPQAPPRGVADREATRPWRHHGAAHHPVPRRGGAARRPDRDPAQGHHHPARDAR
jgi:ABC-2 type transport system ATP-binding protein